MASNNPCRNCSKVWEKIEHKCVSHADCVDQSSGLYDPSDCFHCNHLYDLVRRNDQMAKNKLRDLAMKIGHKAARKGAAGKNIFASEAIRRQYDINGFFKSSIKIPQPRPSSRGTSNERPNKEAPSKEVTSSLPPSINMPSSARPGPSFHRDRDREKAKFAGTGTGTGTGTL